MNKTLLPFASYHGYRKHRCKAVLRRSLGVSNIVHDPKENNLNMINVLIKVTNSITIQKIC